MSGASFRDAQWKTGIKDGKVYIEIWNGETRILDSTLNPDHAYQLGTYLIELAQSLGVPDA